MYIHILPSGKELQGFLFYFFFPEEWKKSGRFQQQKKTKKKWWCSTRRIDSGGCLFYHGIKVWIMLVLETKNQGGWGGLTDRRYCFFLLRCRLLSVYDTVIYTYHIRWFKFRNAYFFWLGSKESTERIQLITTNFLLSTESIQGNLGPWLPSYTYIILSLYREKCGSRLPGLLTMNQGSPVSEWVSSQTTYQLCRRCWDNVMLWNEFKGINLTKA